MDTADTRATISDHTVRHLLSALEHLISAEEASRALRCLGVPAAKQYGAISRIIRAIIELDPAMDEELRYMVDCRCVRH